ncbi:MAG: hypothetical protein ACI959_001505 [Limisphaerales bacterium]|jgi:hypothetical protein
MLTQIKTTLLAILLLGVFSSSAQFLNQGFNDWATGDFLGVVTYDSLVGYDSPQRLGAALGIADSTVFKGPYLASDPTPYEGSNYLKLQTKEVDFLGLAILAVPGAVSTGGFFINLFTLEFGVNPGSLAFSGTPSSIQGVFQYEPVGIDTFYVAVQMTLGGTVIGGGEYVYTNTTTGWTPFTVPIVYGAPFPPDGIDIFITSSKSGDISNAGSTALVDIIAPNCNSAIAPQNPTTTLSGVGALLSWDPVPGPACQIKGRNDAVGFEKTINVLESGVSSYLVPNALLTPGTDYSWNVRCACEFFPTLDATPFSDTSSFNALLRLADLTDQSELTLFPNPANGEFFLTGVSSENVDVMIYNLAGELVSNTFNHSSTEAIQLPETPGAYWVAIQADGKTVVREIINQ